MSQKTKFYIFR